MKEEIINNNEEKELDLIKAFDEDWKNHWCMYCDKPMIKCDCPEYYEPND